MSDRKVSELVEANSLNNDDLLMIVQNGTNKKMKSSVIYENIQTTPEISIGKNQPINGEKIWFKYGKNLFNKNNYNLYNGFIQGDTCQFISASSGRTVYLKVKPSTTYTLSREIVQGGSFAIGTGKNAPVSGQYATFYASYSSLTSATVTTGPEDNYLYMYLLWAEGSTANLLPQILESIMVEVGEEASTYEEFVERNILIKDEEGVYQPFYV